MNGSAPSSLPPSVASSISTRSISSSTIATRGSSLAGSLSSPRLSGTPLCSQPQRCHGGRSASGALPSYRSLRSLRSLNGSLMSLVSSLRSLRSLRSLNGSLMSLVSSLRSLRSLRSLNGSLTSLASFASFASDLPQVTVSCRGHGRPVAEIPVTETQVSAPAYDMRVRGRRGREARVAAGPGIRVAAVAAVVVQLQVACAVGLHERRPCSGSRRCWSAATRRRARSAAPGREDLRRSPSLAVLDEEVLAGRLAPSFHSRRTIVARLDVGDRRT